MRGYLKVGGYSDGPIPWPIRYRTNSIILCGDLVLAVKQEAAEAVSFHWGVCLSGLRHKYDDVRCAQFGLWRGARRAQPLPWGCNRRATKPQAKFGATRRAAALFRPDFVACSSQIHCGICSSLTPRLGEKSLAANVIAFSPQTT